MIPESQCHGLPTTALVQSKLHEEGISAHVEKSDNHEDYRVGFNQHIKEHKIEISHSGSFLKQIVCFEEGIFVCAECNKKFVSKTTLDRHIKIHAIQSGGIKEENYFSDPVTNKDDIRELFSYADCNEMFKSKAERITHVRKDQANSDTSENICSEKKFNNLTASFRILRPNDKTSESQFVKALREDYKLVSESITRYFFCAHCSEKFKFKVDLILHVMTHMK